VRIAGTLAVTLALAAGVAGCSSGPNGGMPTPLVPDAPTPAGDDAPPASPSTKGSAGPASAPTLSQAEAARRLTRAFTAHRRADTAQFVQRVVTDGARGSLTVSSDGGYRISARVARMRTVVTGRGSMRAQAGALHGVPFEYRFLRGALFQQSAGWPATMRRCWKRWPAGELGSQVGADIPGPGLPLSSLEALAGARATGGTTRPGRTTIRATVPAAAAVQLFGADVAELVTRPAGRVPATVVLGRTGIGSLSLDGTPLARLLGTSLTPAQRAVVGAMSVQVGFGKHGAPYTVTEPAKSLQLNGNSCG
jgi:hypothetical protein